MNGDYCVYKHTFPNGKLYIGITSKTPEKRWKKDGAGYQSQRHVYNAIKKYGWNNIKHEILFEHLTKEAAEQKEVELIARFKSNQEQFGYNHAEGGGVNRGFTYVFPEEAKAKMRIKMIGNKNTGRQDGIHNNFYGHHHTKEARKKISESQYRPIIQYTKAGEVIKEFNNCYQAELATGILHIREVCIGLRKSAGGFVWKYKAGGKHENN